MGLRVYPCINPSGFEDGTRYNRSGEKPNNDFLRYEVAPGVWKGELTPRRALPALGALRRRPQGDAGGAGGHRPVPASGTPRSTSTRTTTWRAATYAYMFGDPAAYRPMMEAAAAHAAVIREQTGGREPHQDADGLIEFHDGSVTDYFMRRGVPYAAALETTTRTPPAAATR